MDHHGQEGHDVFKDSLLRYLGYSNEVGEAFRPLVHHRFVTGSYGLAGAYVLADTADKVNLALNDERVPKVARNQYAIEKGLDTLIWQGLASVVIPGACINRVVWAAGKLPLPPRAKSVVPTAIGLASIPLIIYPIDLLVHECLDRSSRPVLRKMTRAKYPSDAGYGTSK
mmetsp:Transcript_25201/g.49093  ORF Transcript_25201/g.49093 Transcript_25201/m.49093 type:complete len:170 (+) Transcript_25201:70-579(+)|eukprot:CAMPEP_0173393084 /NCGR_PEP_ID=MMETSP1356-20130122/21905_1 /TAXON_ID=77927 ORGANISM="Hemiselmis virescens, Strain PCC157" /NCGR_SAMPLE_ID=MMETSP1356 /ASSEMBLY_ACC=CAM_ASM_000847 /LENGTH=169 /DNA_ID=CAMNT_0014351047 /DNA_START=67 /DNA_END=576 /DNA_ORIENTATION=-